MRRWLSDYAEDLLILAGLVSIVVASFLAHVIVGLYTLGAVLVVLGWLLARASAGSAGGKRGVVRDAVSPDDPEHGRDR